MNINYMRWHSPSNPDWFAQRHWEQSFSHIGLLRVCLSRPSFTQIGLKVVNLYNRLQVERETNLDIS